MHRNDKKKKKKKKRGDENLKRKFWGMGPKACQRLIDGVFSNSANTHRYIHRYIPSCTSKETQGSRRSRFSSSKRHHPYWSELAPYLSLSLCLCLYGCLWRVVVPVSLPCSLPRSLPPSSGIEKRRAQRKAKREKINVNVQQMIQDLLIRVWSGDGEQGGRGCGSLCLQRRKEPAGGGGGSRFLKYPPVPCTRTRPRPKNLRFLESGALEVKRTAGSGNLTEIRIQRAAPSYYCCCVTTSPFMCDFED